jgi:dTDP-4-dehydrorhamnose reductase
MKNILVTGASGLLGLNMSLILAREFHVTGVIHQDELRGVVYPVIVSDLSKKGEPEKIIDRIKPDAIIHTAAIANVDACEDQPQRAEEVNAILPGTLAKLAKSHSIPLVHISTDAVFDGIAGKYTELDKANPLSIYARTKYQAELNVANEDPNAIIARVNFYGWSLRGERSLAEIFAFKLLAGETVNGFTDVFFCTLHVFLLVDIIMEMLTKNLSGLYHVVSRESITKFDFGRVVAREFGLNENLVKPISVKDAGLKAARSPNLTLRTEKLAQALGHVLPDQRQGLKQFCSLFQQGYPQVLRSYLKE